MKLIKFKQEQCTPCTILDNFLKFGMNVAVDEEINLTTDGKEAQELAEKYGVMRTPTLVLVDADGVMVDSFSDTDPEKSVSILEKRGLI